MKISWYLGSYNPFGSHYLMKKRLINLTGFVTFVSFWLCWVFIAAQAFLQSWRAGLLSGRSAQASLAAGHAVFSSRDSWT